MASPKAIAWIDTLIWVLIFGGLFGVVLGLATRPQDAAVGWSLIVIGACVTAAGAVLVWVRSRMRED